MSNATPRNQGEGQYDHSSRTLLLLLVVALLSFALGFQTGQRYERNQHGDYAPVNFGTPAPGNVH